MTSAKLYEVTGRRAYRGHQPGEQFVARLDVGPEHRAIARGDIRIADAFVPDLVPGSYTLPPGWAVGTSTSVSEGRR